MFYFVNEITLWFLSKNRQNSGLVVSVQGDPCLVSRVVVKTFEVFFTVNRVPSLVCMSQNVPGS